MVNPVIAAAAVGFDRDLERNFEQIEALADTTRRRGAGLLVLPEGTLGGYVREPGTDESPGLDVPPALAPDGSEIARLARLAGDLVICAGYTEASPTGLYSSAVCVSGDGVLGHQRKVHLPPAERFAYTAGDGFAAFDTPVGRIGMLICYDKLFPEAARTLALDGADIVCALAAWPLDRFAPARRASEDRQTRHFDLVDQMRAVENQVVWVASNQAGPWGQVRFLGRAKVVDPDGNILASTSTRGGLAIAEIDAAELVRDTRLAIDHLADRRPEAYGIRPGAAAAFSG